MRLSAGAIAQIVGGRVVGDSSATATNYVSDSRRAGPSACFFALRGERDGHQFVGDAFERGATIAIVESDALAGFDHPGHSLVVVRAPHEALVELAREVRGRLEPQAVVGVTGSVGKTSTKDLLAAGLGRSRIVHASQESFNNDVGLPLTVLDSPAGLEILVVEMGARFAGDLTRLASVARPTIGVVTNVGVAHAESLGGPEGIAAAKGELVEALGPGGTAVLDADDAWTPELRKRASGPVLLVGSSPAADVRLMSVVLDDSLTPTVRISTPRGEVETRIGLRGEHQARNALFAVAVGLRLGVSLGDMATGLETAAGSAQRMHLAVSPGGVVVLDDSYNANPASMRAALNALERLRPKGSRVAILGDMLELGPTSDEDHVEVGAMAAELGVNTLVGVGPGGSLIARGAASVNRVETFPDVATMVTHLAQFLSPGDAVLVKASRAAGFERVSAEILGGAADGAMPTGDSQARSSR